MEFITLTGRLNVCFSGPYRRPLLAHLGPDCQTASKTDPLSASNIDPSSLCSRTGGEARSGQLAQRVVA